MQNQTSGVMGPGSRFAWPGRRQYLRFASYPTPAASEIAFAQENVKPGADDDGRTGDPRDLWHVAEHDIAEHHGPDDHRILIRHHDACGREFQRAVDAQ
jgi:hypothetical protein